MTGAPDRPPTAHPDRRRSIVLIVLGVLAVAVHLGILGTVLANSRWSGGAADIVLLIVAGKILVITLGRIAVHRRKAARRPTHVRAGRHDHR